MLRAHHIGHLLELPLTSGRSHSIDPEEVVEVGPLHGQPSVTIVRLRDSKFTLYVQGEYEHVREMLRAALSSGSC
jgi:hypothetical protein